MAQAGALVSIGVPVFNAARYLDATLRSLLAQDHPNIELYISDNASTDGSAEICRRFAADHPNVHLNINSQNLGMVENFECVRKMARGSYFFWAGADDLWKPNFVSRLVDELERYPSSPLAMSATEMIGRDDEPLGTIAYEGRLNPNSMSPLQQFSTLMTVSTSIKLAKLNLFFCGLWRLPELNAIVSVDPSIHFGGDRPMPAVGALIGGLRYVPHPLFIKRIHEGTFRQRNSSDPYVLVRQEHGVGKIVSDMVRWIVICPRIPIGRKIAASLHMLRFPLAYMMRLAISYTPGPIRRAGVLVLRGLGLMQPMKWGR